jgi:hypothetical protein
MCLEPRPDQVIELRFKRHQHRLRSGPAQRLPYEMGLLKRYPRTGWALAGVPVAESVAEHSFRASVIAAVIAATEDADPQRAAFLAL